VVPLTQSQLRDLRDHYSSVASTELWTPSKRASVFGVNRLSSSSMLDVVMVVLADGRVVSAPLKQALLNPLAMSISPRGPITLRNLYANAVTQGLNLSQPMDLFFRRAGYGGRNEIIGLSDTGIDHDHCMFRDSSRAVPVNHVDYAHRKIVYYEAYADNMDDTIGHGTHVAGSVAGACESRTSVAASWDSSAIHAKIAFFDIGYSPSSGPGALVIPDDISDGIFSHLYNVGARVFSVSWGVDENVYDELALQADKFLYTHRDAILLIASGNRGSAGTGSIGTPATAKNVLSVGATISLPYSMSYGAASFGKSLSVRQVSARLPDDLYIASPPSACTVAGTTFLQPTVRSDVSRPKTGMRLCAIARGDCSFMAKVYNAQMLGCDAVMIYNMDDAQSVQTMTCDDTGDITVCNAIVIPSFLVSRFLFNLLNTTGTHVSLAGTNLLFTTSDSDAQTTVYTRASFSSYGPTAEGRTKPEVMSPGSYIESASSDRNVFSKNCDFRRMQGTSMATPVAASATAVMREYWRDHGNFHNGFSTVAGSMLRAVALASAMESDGTLRYGPFFAEDLKSGLGARNIIAIDHDEDAIRGIQSVADRHDFCIVGTEAGSVSVVLAWTDPPNPSLVNDLDLYVNDANGLGDHIHTHEKQSVFIQQGETVTISVRASRLGMGPQGYSLLIHGFVKRIACGGRLPLAMGACNPAEKEPCGGRGVCMGDGRCVCVAVDVYGPTCSDKVMSLDADSDTASGGKLSVKLLAQGWQYFRLAKTTVAAVITINGPSTVSAYVRQGGFPTLHLFQQSDPRTVRLPPSVAVRALQEQGIERVDTVMGIYNAGSEAAVVSLQWEVDNSAHGQQSAALSFAASSYLFAVLVIIGSFWV
jgi:subtilisin family serine protease